MIASLFPLPPLCVGIPNTVGEQTIQIGKIWVTVVVEAQAFAIFLARPLAVPDFASRIIRVEVQSSPVPASRNVDSVQRRSQRDGVRRRARRNRDRVRVSYSSWLVC
jgi:hypothetical protein